MHALLLAALLHAAAAETRFRDDYVLRAEHDHDSVERAHKVRRHATPDTLAGVWQARNNPSHLRR